MKTDSFLLIDHIKLYAWCSQHIAKFIASIDILAKIILPPRGDSTCAFNNQEFNPYTGVFTANAINIPQNNKNCIIWSKFVLNKAS